MPVHEDAWPPHPHRTRRQPGHDAAQHAFPAIRFTPGSSGSIPNLFNETQWRVLAAHFGLSSRQRDVARLICAGCTYKAIALLSGISVNTVRMHIRDLFDKVHAHDRVSVVVRLVTTERALARRDAAAHSADR